MPAQVAERRAAIASVAGEYSRLVPDLPDDVLATEAAPDIFGRLRSAGDWLARAAAARTAPYAAACRTEAQRVLTAPARRAW
jgi:hypothetical protein